MMLSENLDVLQNHAREKEIKNWVWKAVVVTIFVCFPIGVFGLIYAIISRVKLRKGNYEASKKTAKIAGILTITAFITGMAYFAFLGIYYLVDPGGFGEIIR